MYILLCRKKRDLLGVAGNSLDTIGGVSLTVDLAKETLQNYFVVVRYFPYLVLLGMDFLINLVTDFRKREVTLSAQQRVEIHFIITRVITDNEGFWTCGRGESSIRTCVLTSSETQECRKREVR